MGNSKIDHDYIDLIYSDFQKIAVNNGIPVDLEKVGAMDQNLPEHFKKKFSGYAIRFEQIKGQWYMYKKEGDAGITWKSQKL